MSSVTGTMHFSIRQALRNPLTIDVLRKHNVMYLDKGLIVINKPSGLVSQGTIDEQKKEGTVQVAIDDIRPALGLKEGPFPIHRLDKPTTGTFILATTAVQAKALSRAFMHKESSDNIRRTAIKRYIALVYTGSPEIDRGVLNDLVRGAIKIDPSSNGLTTPVETIFSQTDINRFRLDLHTNINGRVSLWKEISGDFTPLDIDHELRRKRVAISQVDILSSSAQHPIALVGMRLYTGIKHQLRVTLASHLKIPVLGDELYGQGFEESLLPPKLVPPNKLMLHASSVSLQRFKNKKPFWFHICARPPQEFLDICHRSGIDVPLPLRNGGVWYDTENVANIIKWDDEYDKNFMEDTSGVFAVEGAWLSTM
ncbi:hypothetical protein FRC17_002078 [Serendipita sp. 399]|nr:hypothetical protein FRC17_002078 [Serendipita sp. 399]